MADIEVTEELSPGLAGLPRLPRVWVDSKIFTIRKNRLQDLGTPREVLRGNKKAKDPVSVSSSAHTPYATSGPELGSQTRVSVLAPPAPNQTQIRRGTWCPCSSDLKGPEKLMNQVLISGGAGMGQTEPKTAMRIFHP